MKNHKDIHSKGCPEISEAAIKHLSFTLKVLLCFPRKESLWTSDQGDELSKHRYIHLLSIKVVRGKYTAKLEGKGGKYACIRNPARSKAM